MTYVIAFVVTILVIVAIHEFGHYLTMRLFGVRVLTFSIGFGPRLWTWRDRHGTDFTVSAIPLGGYVKPLDRRDSEIPPDQLHEEFSGKPAWQRVITYAAGPAANLLLALLLYWVVLLGGEQGVAPLLDAPPAGTPAAAAGVREGDEILSVGGEPVVHWGEVAAALLPYAGETGTLPLEVRGENGQLRRLELSLVPWAARQMENPLEMLGLRQRPPQAVVGDLQSGSPAEEAGLAPGDRVLSVNGEPVTTWNDWVAVVQDHPGQRLRMRVQRGADRFDVEVTPRAVERDGRTIGVVGVGVAGLREIHYGPLAAVPEAFSRVSEQVAMIIGSIGKLIVGKLSVETLGGPFTIAQAAGETAAVGITTFLVFLAFFSISLGVINLLPIPMLDGGWIVFGLVEMVIGRPLPDRFLMAAQSVGMTLVFALMLVAIYNDLVRHFV